MIFGRTIHFKAITGAIAAIVVLGSCNITRNVPKDKYLLRSNSIKLNASVPIKQKGTLVSNMEKLIAQKPNSRFVGIPFKLIRYNAGYKKYQADPGNNQVKTKAVEPPVIYDSTLKKRSALNIRSYLFNKGFFYAKVTDTTLYKGNRAYVKYNIETGTNYIIHNVTLDVNNEVAQRLLTTSMPYSFLKPGTDFSYDLCEQEKSRMVNFMRDSGYYKLNTDHFSFELDTFNKQYLSDVESPFESAVNFLALQKKKKKPTLDIRVIVRNDEFDTYYRFGISTMRIMPDFQSSKDYRDTTMIQDTLEGVVFKYHKKYVNENVILRHMLMKIGRYYSQYEYDQTLSKLNELGVFSSVRISYRLDTSKKDNTWLHSTVVMTPADKFNYSTSWELSNGTNYFAGTNLTLSLRNNNVGKGANLLTTSVNGGLETAYDSSGFRLLTRSVGGNISLDMPKFLFPLKQSEISSNNTPRTITSIGVNVLDRVNYFTLVNISTAFQYRWRETKYRNWEISPVFINNIRVPYLSDSFKERLKQNQYLRNTYSPTLIEGENVARIYSDKEVKHGLNYSYMRWGIEEAGGLLSGVNAIAPLGRFYSQYAKLDLDAQHFFTYEHSTIACRFLAGIGIPYDKSTTLPYIKQYFVGGPYSLRGFRIRTLGPGSYIDLSGASGNLVVDRTGDIKLESTVEYRFDMFKLFNGAIKMNGALFADAGNIWLYNTSNTGYTNGEFGFGKLGKDLAIDAGLGIRMDLSGFFIFRVDMGIPMKKPAYFDFENTVAQPANVIYGTNGWVISKISPSDPEWRKSEMVINFAIGYPF